MANISNSLGHLRRRTPTKNERPRKTSSGLEHPHRGAKCAFYHESERKGVRRSERGNQISVCAIEREERR